MMNPLFRHMNIPKSCEVGKTIFKKLFYNADLGKADRNLFTEQIDKIIWAYCLKPDTISIKPYKDDIREYTEIEVLEVIISSKVKMKRIAEIIMRTIPYPMLLTFVFEKQIQFCVAHQRTNITDSSKNTIEEFIFTDWIDLDNLTDKDKQFLVSLDIKQMSFTDYYRLYSEIVNKIITYNASKLTENYIEYKDAIEVKAIYNQVADLDRQIDELKCKIKKESQFNRRVEMNIQVKKLENAKNNIISMLE